MQSFTLDLKTLLQILSRQKQHGLLQADISSDKLRFPGTRQILQASILLENGIVRACTVVLKQGERVAEGQDALQLLLGAGVVEWHWKANIPQLPRPSEEEGVIHQVPTTGNSPFFAAFVPQRTPSSEAALPTLPREYRKILALVDGQRSVHKLAAVLLMKDEDVMTALRTLQSWGLIL